MSRIAKNPVIIPSSIKFFFNKNVLFLIKDKLKIKCVIHPSVILSITDNKIFFNVNKKYFNSWMYAGTTRSIINNYIIGLINGFSKKLVLVGIGYKAYIENNILFLNLGFSYTIKYKIPLSVSIKCIDFNNIIIKGYDKQLVGQIASEIRSFKKPECYKSGKGIRYKNEFVKIKESKKKIK